MHWDSWSHSRRGRGSLPLLPTGAGLLLHYASLSEPVPGRSKLFPGLRSQQVGSARAITGAICVWVSFKCLGSVPCPRVCGYDARRLDSSRAKGLLFPAQIRWQVGVNEEVAGLAMGPEICSAKPMSPSSLPNVFVLGLSPICGFTQWCPTSNRQHPIEKDL